MSRSIHVTLTVNSRPAKIFAVCKSSFYTNGHVDVTGRANKGGHISKESLTENLCGYRQNFIKFLRVFPAG
jgi:hypothetical protein